MSLPRQNLTATIARAYDGRGWGIASYNKPVSPVWVLPMRESLRTVLKEYGFDSDEALSRSCSVISDRLSRFASVIWRKQLIPEDLRRLSSAIVIVKLRENPKYSEKIKLIEELEKPGKVLVGVECMINCPHLMPRQSVWIQSSLEDFRE